MVISKIQKDEIYHKRGECSKCGGYSWRLNHDLCYECNQQILCDIDKQDKGRLVKCSKELKKK